MNCTEGSTGTGGSCAPDYAQEIAANAFFLILTVLMATMGLVGNTLVIGAVLAHKKLRTLGNAFVINLAVADLCVTTFVDSFGVVGIVTNGHFFDDQRLLCELMGVVCVTSCACSMWNIAHISFNRYVRICHHQIYPKMYNKRTIPFIILGTWVVCFLIDLPNLLGWGAHDFDPKIMMCTYNYTESYTYTVFFIAMGFGIPLLVTSFSYISIIRLVRQAESNAKRGKETSAPAQEPGRAVAKKTQTSTVSKTDIRLLRSVFTIWVVFLVMWSPYALVVLFDFNYLWPRAAYVVAIVLAHTNSSINGILYAATNRHFREGYVYLLSRCAPRCIISNRIDVAQGTDSTNAQ